MIQLILKEDRRWYDNESGLEIINPEIAFKWIAPNWFENDKMLNGKVEPGILYPWDGGWEISCGWSPGRSAEFCSRCMGNCPDKVLRLLPKSPVIEFTNSSDFGGDNLIINPSPSKSGIAAIGVPHSDYYRCSCEATRARGIAVMCFVCDEKKIPKDVTAPVNDAGGGREKNEAGKKYTISPQFMKDAEDYFEGSDRMWPYSIEDAKEIYAMAAQRGYDVAQPSPQAESQEELWESVMNNYIYWGDQEHNIADLLKDFTINRK
jgi:hypothetical protein